MKNLSGLLLIGVLGFFSCNKSGVTAIPVSSLEIINAISASPGAQLNANPNAVYYGSYGQFGILAGSSTGIYVFPTGDSLHPYVNTSLAAVSGGIYSLYLTGTDQQAALLLKDTIPSYTDSSTGFRFINLSPGSSPLSINIQGNYAGTIAGSLAYKAITSFGTYSANSDVLNNGGYTFEIRNAADSTLLTTVQVTPPVFKNQTIAIEGLVSDGSINAVVVNNY
jgi:hypothetical protein